MKLLITLTFLAFTNLGYSQSEALSEKTSFSKNDYEIQFPKAWTIDTSRALGAEFFIFAPLENENDKFRENVNVIIQNLANQNIDLEKYKNITEGQINQMATDGKIFESLVIKSEKVEYYKIIYAMTQGKFRLKIMSYCYIIDEKAYLVTFGSEFDNFDRYKETGVNILNSFTVTK